MSGVMCRAGTATMGGELGEAGGDGVVRLSPEDGAMGLPPRPTGSTARRRPGDAASAAAEAETEATEMVVLPPTLTWSSFLTATRVPLY